MNIEMVETVYVEDQSVSVSELESSPGYLGGGLEVLESVKLEAGSGTGAGAGAASRGRTLLSCMSPSLPLMSPLPLMSSSALRSGSARFSLDM